MVEVRVLGGVEVVGADGVRVDVGGPRPSAIVLTLALAGGAFVSAQRLVDEVWGDAAPASALDTLQSYVSRLRRVLDPDRVAHAGTGAVQREAAGYRFDLEVVSIDALRFDREVAAARDELADGAARAGVARLRAALATWRGEVGEGLELGTGNRVAATRLDELRLGALEAQFAAQLELGDHVEVVAELEALVAAHPVREQLHALRMLALYRCDRQAEALAAFREARSRLIDTLGVDPSRRLTDLHERMLAHDPTLDLVGAAPRTPPPAAPAPRLGNLPAALVELVGRDDARRAVEQLVDDHPLVTLTGAGGCGKTQLALHVAHDLLGRDAGSDGGLPDGAWWVDLQTLDDPGLVPGAVAEVLGVDDAPPPQLVDALAARLAHRRALVIVDNCEHVIDAVADLLAGLLQRCPGVRWLATSRQPLDLDGERVWRVPSLSLPPASDDLTGSDAAALFLRRAAAARPGFVPGDDDTAAIAAICRRLDGIPLALELAAARIRVLSPEELAARLDDGPQVLRSSRRGMPPRHRTLDATIGWSDDLLDPAARQLLRRLSVFQGSVGVAAIEAVCADDDLPVDVVLEALDTLVDRSLVVTVPSPVGPARHRLLNSIRAYARRHLDVDATTRLRHRHAAFHAELADTAAGELTGPDQVRWLNRLHLDHDDLRAALGWSLEAGSPEVALRIGAGVWWFWLQFGHAREGASWLERILAVVDADEHTIGTDRQLQQARYGAGRLLGAVGASDRARVHLQRGAQLAARLDRPGALALCRARLAQLLHADDQPAAAARAFAAARRDGERCDDAWVHAGVADVAGHLAAAAGDLDAAAAAFEAGEHHYLEVADRWSACLSRLGRAWVARRRGALSTALALHGENLRSTRTLTRSAYDFVGLPRDLRGVAVVASAVGQHGPAVRLCGASEGLRTLGDVALTPDERAEVDGVLARATSTLGHAAAARWQAGGRSLGAGEALEEALALTALEVPT